MINVWKKFLFENIQCFERFWGNVLWLSFTYPSPLYPVSQRHMNEPSVLVQVALGWQPPLLVKHSSMSSHSVPSPRQPSRHRHWNEPCKLKLYFNKFFKHLSLVYFYIISVSLTGKLIQSAAGWQSQVPSSHSSSSVQAGPCSGFTLYPSGHRQTKLPIVLRHSPAPHRSGICKFWVHVTSKILILIFADIGFWLNLSFTFTSLRQDL